MKEILGAILCLGVTAATATAAAPAAGAKNVAVIDSTDGRVTVERRPGAAKVSAAAKMPLPEGAVVTTSKGGAVTIRFGAADVVNLGENTQVWLAQVAGAKPTHKQTVLALAGKMRVEGQSLAVVAGSTLAKANAATFEVTAPAPGVTSGKVTVQCEAGSVAVGVVKSDEDLAVFKVTSVATTPLEAGYQVAASATTGKLEAPTVAMDAGAAPAAKPAARPAAPAAAAAVPSAEAVPAAAGVTAAPAAAPVQPKAQPGTAPAVATARPAAGRLASAGLGVIETAVGDVRVRLRSGSPAQKATVGLKLVEGAVLRTGPTGRVFIRFGPTDLVRISPNSEMWIAQLRAPKAGKAQTILQLLAGRARAMLRRKAVTASDYDFVMSAGTAVAAVKGTDFEMSFPKADGPVNVRVDDGVVMMAGIASWDLADILGAVSSMTKGVGGRAVSMGFAVTVDSGTGRIGTPQPSPPRTRLEVVSAAGRVTVTTGTRTVRAWPGDEVPPGARIVVSGGEAVFAGPREAVEAGSGAQFSYEVRVGAATGEGPPEIRTTVTAGVASRAPVVIDTGVRTTTLVAGESAVMVGGGEIAQATARAATREATVAPSRRAAAAAAPEPVVEGELEPMPELPALASAAPLVVAQTGGEMPPPPPDTVNQDTNTVSPSAPR